MRGLFATGIGILFFTMLFGCASTSPPLQEGKLKVVASFYPIYEFAREVGGERTEVSLLMPPEAEPHSFEPKPSDVKKIADADLLVINGAGLEDRWIGKILGEAVEGGRKKPKIVDASTGIDLIKFGKAHEDEEEDHWHAEYDPHVWLSPSLAQKQVENIKKAFIEADPQGKEQYEQNAEKYKEKLAELDGKFRQAFRSCKKKEILITHATLGYFCMEYGCKQIPIEGITHEGEPSPSMLAEIIESAKESNASAVYFEKMIDPKSAKAIASEIGAKTLVFNSVHGLSADEKRRGENYLSLMEGNLINIKIGLECG
ncbi:MAG: metal ABC transporter substrate-binding protein [Candidatus Anstonellaceae archaeon]